MVARVLFPWLTAWRNTIASPPTGDHQGNKCRSHPLPATLAPTDGPASCLTSRLRVMRMRADQSAVGTVNRPLRLIAYKHTYIQPLDLR